MKPGNELPLPGFAYLRVCGAVGELFVTILGLPRSPELYTVGWDASSPGQPRNRLLQRQAGVLC